MKEKILGKNAQYKITDEGKFFSREIVVDENYVVVSESWREIKPCFGKCDYTGAGYYSISASLGKKTSHRLHRLVALHFVDGYKPGLNVNHIDGDRTNNSASNLEWVSHKENMENAVKRGVLDGRNKYRGKIDEFKALTIVTLINSGVSNIKISRIFNIDPSNVSKIRNKSELFKSVSCLVDPERKTTRGR